MQLTEKQISAIAQILTAQIGTARMEREAYKTTLRIASPFLAQKNGKYTGGITKETYHALKNSHPEIITLAQKHRNKDSVPTTTHYEAQTSVPITILAEAQKAIAQHPAKITAAEFYKMIEEDPSIFEHWNTPLEITEFVKCWKSPIFLHI
jgi:hypothetical protein